MDGLPAVEKPTSSRAAVGSAAAVRTAVQDVVGCTPPIAHRFAPQFAALDLGTKNIRVNALSAAPARTLASAAIRDFHAMAHEVEERSPLRRAMRPEEVGRMATALLSDFASGVTGQTVYADMGYNIVGL